MKRSISRRSFFLATGLLLALAVFLSLPSSVTLGNSSNSTVNVNAQIQPSQVLNVEDQVSGNSRSKALIPIKFGDVKKRESGRHVSTGTISLDLGSNKNWKLFAKITNLKATRESLEDSGWKLEGFILGLGRKKTELKKTHRKVADGSYGKHELEVFFEVIISKSSSTGEETPPFSELENVIVFALR